MSAVLDHHDHAHDDHHGAMHGWRRWVFATNHKDIGTLYLLFSFAMLMIGGVLALLIRAELAQPGMQVMTLDQYNTVMSLHGIVMIVGILLGVGAMSNYLVPLMIGANDMAFPRLNAFAYWVNVPAAILLMLVWPLGGFDTGWTGYPPLSAKAPMGMQMFFLGVYFVGFSSIFGALINNSSRQATLSMSISITRKLGTTAQKWAEIEEQRWP